MMKRVIFGILMVAIALAGGTASAGTTIGRSEAPNCYPFGCGPTDGLTRYQQVFSASVVPGLLTFDTLSYNVSVFGRNKLDTGTYAIAFYYATHPLGSQSIDLSTNLGRQIGMFGTFTLGGSAPTMLSFTGSRLTYDPTRGDLLMDVGVSNGSSVSGSYNAALMAGYNSSPTQRSYSSISETAVNHEGAPVTTFSLAGGVPEPASWMMMIGGCGLVGGAMRRRSRLANHLA